MNAADSRRSRADARERADLEARSGLVESLVALVDRTYAESGRGEGIRLLRDMLLRLDPPALRDMLRSFGVEGPEELAEPEPEDRPRSG